MISVCVLVGVYVGALLALWLVVRTLCIDISLNHKRSLPGAAFGRGVLLLSDLAARTLFRPAELPIGVSPAGGRGGVRVHTVRSRKAAQS